MNNNNNTAQFEGLPAEVANSTLTNAQKRVLEVLYAYNALDKTKENDGEFFISNDELMNKAGIGSKTTLSKVLATFIAFGFITRKAGNFASKKASAYTLDTQGVYEWAESHQNSRTPDCTQINQVIESAIAGAIQPIIEELKSIRQTNSKLLKEISELKSDIKSTLETLTRTPMRTPMRTLSPQGCTTDIDTVIPYGKNYKNNSIEYPILSATAEKTGNDSVRTASGQCKQNWKQFNDLWNGIQPWLQQYRTNPTDSTRQLISNQYEKIKTLHTEGGCTDKQYAMVENIVAPLLSHTDGDNIDNSISTPSTNDKNTVAPLLSSADGDNNNITSSDTNSSSVDSLISNLNIYTGDILSTINAISDKLKDADEDTKRRYYEMFSVKAKRNWVYCSVLKDKLFPQNTAKEEAAEA